MLPFIIAAAVLVAAVLIVSYPLIFNAMESHRAEPTPGAEYSERDALLEAMSELEGSFQTGKLSAADYEHQKAGLRRQYLRAQENPGDSA